jgi:hypothetical protein
MFSVIYHVIRPVFDTGVKYLTAQGLQNRRPPNFYVKLYLVRTTANRMIIGPNKRIDHSSTTLP